MPLARTTLLPVIVEFAEKYGVPRRDLLDELELDPSLLSHPSTVVESSVLIDAVAYAARAGGQRDFGLKLGSCNDPRALGPIGVLVDHCVSVSAALTAAARYLHMHNSALNYELTPDGPLYVYRLRLTARGKHPSAQYLEMCLALCMRFCTLLMGDAWKPEWVAFEHDREADPAAYRRTFRAPVRFAQGMNALVAQRADFDRPIDRSAPHVRDLLQGLVDALDRQHSEDIVARLLPVLRPLLAAGDASAARAATVLGLSARTLQRRLAERGATFQRILDDLRLQLVREYLPRRSMSLAELAPILGFSEASAVSRFLRASGGFKHHKRDQTLTAGE